MSLQPQEPAAAAFEQLRAEVTLLRRSIEGLTAAQGRKPVDYSPTLGKLSKSLSAIQAQLAGLEEPNAIITQIDEFARLAIRTSTQSLATPLAELREDRAAFRQWSSMIAEHQARRVENRSWWNRLAIAASTGFFVGMLSWGLLLGPVARALPASWEVPEALAAATLRRSKGEAALRLMQVADPLQHRRLVVLRGLPESAIEPLRKCIERMGASKASVRCDFRKVSAKSRESRTGRLVPKSP